MPREPRVAEAASEGCREYHKNAGNTARRSIRVVGASFVVTFFRQRTVVSIAYIPRIDHERRQAIIVNRYPGKKVCARITTHPLHTALRAILPITSKTANH